MQEILNWIYIFGAEYLIYLAIVGAMVFFVMQPPEKKKELLVFTLITLPLIYLTAFLLSKLYYNPRPFVIKNFIPLVPHQPDNGFPSDHTLLAAAIAVLIYFKNKHWGIDFFIVAALIGISRMYVGVHHGLDIVASLLIATAIGFISYRFIYPLTKKNPTKNPTPNTPTFDSWLKKG